ncbi:MAG TPA: hypothetical protein VGE67_05065 [Haloferula sp.]
MTDPAERFIEAAVLPLADNAEMQIGAEHELRAAIDGAVPGPNDDPIGQAAENLGKGGLPRGTMAILCCLTALAVILAAINMARSHTLRRFANSLDFGLPDRSLIPALRYRPETVGVSKEADKLLLFGDLFSTAPSGQHFRALWDSAPESAAYFSEHARESAARSPALPPNYLAIADRLDPENAWFRCLAAGFAAKDAVENNPRGPSTTPAGHIPGFMVKNPAKLAEVVTLLEEAARQPRFDSYERELLLQRIEVLPPGNDTAERFFVASFLSAGPPSAHWTYQHIANAVSVKGHELAMAGDSEGFLKLVSSWETFVRRSVENADDDLFPGFPNAAKELTFSAKTLGLAQTTERYQRLATELKRRRNVASSRKGNVGKLLMHGGNDALRLLQPMAALENPPPLTEADLRPGHKADSERWERLRSAVMGAMMLATILPLIGLRYLGGPLVRRLSTSLSRVLQPADYAWIFIGGVVLPLLVHVLAAPLEATNPGDSSTSVFQMRMALQSLILLAIPFAIAARRLDRRLGCIGWHRHGIPEPVAIGLGVALVLAFRFASPRLTDGVTICMVPFALAYLILPLGILRSRHNSAIFWQTCRRALVPAHLLFVLLMAVLVLFHHAREKHWTELNTLTKIEPGVPALSRYEHEAAQQIRKELLELLDAKP